MKKIKINDSWTFENMLRPSKKTMVDLPHDAMQTEKRIPKLKNGQSSGFYPGGKYKYEKEISISREEIQKTYILEFEGIYQKSSVYLNDELVGGRIYGYSNFMIDLTGKMKEGSNIICVIADNSQTPNSRWYTGSGIYRDVYLHISGSDHIKPYGIKAVTKSINPAVLDLTIDAVTGDGVDIISEIYYKSDKVASMTGSTGCVEIQGAHLWSAESPEFYDIRIKLQRGEEILDESKERIGIRQITWSGTEGLMINGEAVKLRGGCVHHDHAFIGACSFHTAELRRARIMKESGFNAVRYSHNPANKAFLDACDEVGLYVMDETFDMWNKKKSDMDYGLYFRDEWEKDLKDMIRVAFNHPSVIMYSIGNEIPDIGLSDGVDWTKKLVDCARGEDSSRPVINCMNMGLAGMAAKGIGLNSSKTTPNDEIDPYREGKSSGAAGSLFINMVIDALVNMGPVIQKLQKPPKEMNAIARKVCPYLDISGYNYSLSSYEMHIKEMPDSLICGSETFTSDIAPHWRYIENHSNVIGEFLWTGWDYLGESGAGLPRYGKMKKGFTYPYPGICGNSGCIDLTGRLEGQGAYVAAVWKQLDKPYIAVRPLDVCDRKVKFGGWRITDAVNCWSWEGHEGKKTTVYVYANKGKKVELRLNGTSLGKKDFIENKAEFAVSYQPGVLEAVTFGENGSIIEKSSLISAEKNTQLTVIAEQSSMKAEEKDIAYIDIELTDKNGILKMGEQRKITVSVEGAGYLAGLGSANPLTEEAYTSNTYTTYRGRVVAIVRGNGKKGNIKVVIKSDGMETKTAAIKAV